MSLTGCPAPPPKFGNGLLIVLNGKKRGMEFRIHLGYNTVGRDKTNDICLDSDNKISDYNACEIYNFKKQFFIFRRHVDQLIRVNGKTVFENGIMNAELKDRDIIQVGQTKLILRTICNVYLDYPSASDCKDSFVRIDDSE